MSARRAASRDPTNSSVSGASSKCRILRGESPASARSARRERRGRRGALGRRQRRHRLAAERRGLGEPRVSHPAARPIRSSVFA